MKSKFKVFGIIALVAVIGFSVVGCKNNKNDDGGGSIIQGNQSVRWEYTTVRGANVNTITEKANELGMDGWELVSTSGDNTRNYDTFTLFFKRRLP